MGWNQVGIESGLGTMSGIESPNAHKMSILKGGVGFSSTTCASQLKLSSSKELSIPSSFPIPLQPKPLPPANNESETLN
jgi:hypothetical protein